MPDIYDRIRGNATVRSQSFASGNPASQLVSTPGPRSGMEGMMDEPSVLSKHVETQEKAGQFNSFVEQDPELKGAFDKVQQFAMGLREKYPDITPEDAQKAVQMFIAQELQ